MQQDRHTAAPAVLYVLPSSIPTTPTLGMQQAGFIINAPVQRTKNVLKSHRLAQAFAVANEDSRQRRMFF